MGQEINTVQFKPDDYKAYRSLLEEETKRLQDWFVKGRMAEDGLVGGFEIECWLLDEHCLPAPRNLEFLQRFNNPLVSPELARFNLEFNNQPLKLQGEVFGRFRAELEQLWSDAERCAQSFEQQMSLMMIGILPTLQSTHLGDKAMSTMRRYYALNEQIMKRRHQDPIHFTIEKKDRLDISSHTVMLEAATTSFQIHLQVPASLAHYYYNASLHISAPMVAISANSPFLFQHQLWDETRIPLFEHAIDTANKHTPIKRVSFGSGFLLESIYECFVENLDHFHVLLPVVDRQARHLEHLRLHNGAIWRWNRPLIGFDQNNVPHVRIEHRVMAAGPTLVDMLANAVFYYGLVVYWARQFRSGYELPSFVSCRNNFYSAASDSLNAQLAWEGKVISAHDLILDVLLEQAREGLSELKITKPDIEYYLGIIQHRAESAQTGASWQRRMLETCLGDYEQMTERYLKWQSSGLPVHQWDST